MDLEKHLLRKVGEAIHRFKMIRDGDRIAVAVSGGKDSVTLLEALLLLQKKAPIRFSICAFTVEQGKFLAPVQAVGDYIQSLGVKWTYFTDNPSLRLLEEQPDHGCDMCSRFRRRAVYQIARGLDCNVIAFGHTADDFCESLLRNIMYTGRISALPAITYSKQKDFRLIRPLVYVNEELTRGWVEAKGLPVVPCGCSLRTGTVRRGIRETLADWERETPHLRENILTAMGNINHGRLLDTRYLDLDGEQEEAQESPDPVPNDGGAHPCSRDSATTTCAGSIGARRSPVATPGPREHQPQSPPPTEKRACSSRETVVTGSALLPILQNA